MPIPNRIRERIVTGLKRMLPIIAQQKTRDISEADTGALVKNVLSDALGYGLSIIRFNRLSLAY